MIGKNGKNGKNGTNGKGQNEWTIIFSNTFFQKKKCMKERKKEN